MAQSVHSACNTLHLHSQQAQLDGAALLAVLNLNHIELRLGENVEAVHVWVGGGVGM